MCESESAVVTSFGRVMIIRAGPSNARDKHNTLHPSHEAYFNSRPVQVLARSKMKDAMAPGVVAFDTPKPDFITA
jgi:hypothetical protein